MISTDKKLIYADLTYQIRGAIFTVYNTLGYGHKEQVYQKALEKEFTETNLPFKREVGLNVSYKNEIVGRYRPDFVIDDKVIMELKAVEFMPKTCNQKISMDRRQSVKICSLSAKIYLFIRENRV